MAMNLEQIFNRLSLGVLANLSVGGEGSGNIPVAHHRRVAMMVDNALVELYAKFNLLQREMVIRIYGARTEYPFEKRFADQDATVAPKFIEDKPSNIFTEDVMKVLQIYNEWGEEIILNDPGDATSLYTPNSKMLLVPYPVAGDRYHILYQAYHPRVTPVESNESGLQVPLETSVLLPSFLVPALEHHVAYQVLSSMVSPESAQKALEHFQRFSTICLEAELRDQTTTSLVQTHSKLEDRGFV